MRSIKPEALLAAFVAGAVSLATTLLTPAAAARAQEPRGDKAISDARPPSAARRSWEYKQTWPCRTREKDSSPTELNELGKEGWELVSFTPNSFQSQACFVATFKREVPR